jgi:methionyl-tRNA synthetase
MRRHLITSALPYINGVKHLGNLVGSMLPADVYARYLRQRGEEVLYVCATDEHGTPAELAAVEAGMAVAAFCQEQHAVQQALGERFGLSWDVFGRSSSPQNRDCRARSATPRTTGMATMEQRAFPRERSRPDDRPQVAQRAARDAPAVLART